MFVCPSFSELRFYGCCHPCFYRNLVTSYQYETQTFKTYFQGVWVSGRGIVIFPEEWANGRGPVTSAVAWASELGTAGLQVGLVSSENALRVLYKV